MECDYRMKTNITVTVLEEVIYINNDLIFKFSETKAIIFGTAFKFHVLFLIHKNKCIKNVPSTYPK